MKVDFAKLERAFYPKSVAVVGDKSINNYIWLRGQRNFKGKLYSVQVDPRELDGIKALGVPNYFSLLDIPEPIDFVIVAVPRPIAQRILEDCIKKDVAAAHFFTSGFSETDTEDGKLAEKKLIERALEANFHLIGPNCMGIYSPAVGLCQTARQPTGFNGNVGFIAQSGTHAITFSEEAYSHCMEINKSVSFGNGRVLDATDFLDYFSTDDRIKAIGMYLEGTRDGQRFLKALKGVTAKKPVVIWKGGRTEEGGRAIASHTGSLAVPQAIWNSALRQCGAIQVASIEELADTLNAILLLKPVFGNRVGIAGGSGGQSVAIADVFAENGLKVPTLTKESYDKLASFFVLIGSSYRNPIDPSVNRKEMVRIMGILEQDANIDNLVLMTSITSQLRATEQIDKDINMLVDLRNKSQKPVAVVLGYSSTESAQETRAMEQKLHEVGVPTFASVERGAKALRNAHEYYLLKNNSLSF